jgi:hypothetical protein
MPDDTEPSPAAEEPKAADKPSEESSETGPGTSAEEVAFKIQFGKNSSDVKRPLESTVGDLKDEIEKQLGIPAKLQKLMCKGSALKDDSITLRQVTSLGRPGDPAGSFNLRAFRAGVLRFAPCDLWRGGCRACFGVAYMAVYMFDILGAVGVVHSASRLDVFVTSRRLAARCQACLSDPLNFAVLQC